jgi:radical SAM superfamily enzyme YgiQ (UPF0313 family)
VKPSGKKGLSFAFDLIPLGLEYIAAYIEDSVEDVHIVDMEVEREPLQFFIDLYRPELIGITMSATEHNEGLRLAEIAKKNGISTVVGGYHPTAVPELLLSFPQVDMVIRGEGELTMKELVEKGSPEGVLGVSYKRDGKIVHNKERPMIEDLDALPFPARRLRRYLYGSSGRSREYDVLMTSRGCWGRCSFCCEPSMNRGRLRCRSPENVMKEILEIVKYHEGKPLNVFFVDPNFMGDPKRIDRLCDLLREHDLDINFCALVRTDSMARNPELVKKMCEVGIIWFEMGIESPNMKDLNSTRKGTTTKTHREAVRNIRENGGSAGGTFVIGLPNQTEEEVKRFPKYAKEIGLTAAAFGIVTPFPGTEFYEELNGKGLIFETDWDKFDEMHSVYKTKYLSKEKIEELATYCMAKFWTLDTFIDQEKVYQKITKRKTSLVDFIRERVLNVSFLNNAGTELFKENFDRHLKVFLRAYADPCVEAYSRKISLHEVLEMSRFLNILGPQKIRCTLRYDEVTISFIFKTTKKTVKYIRVMHGRPNDSTINFDFDLKEMGKNRRISIMGMMKRVLIPIACKGNIKKSWNMLRLFIAVGVEFLTWKLMKKRQR